MVYTTLNKIFSLSPSADAWENLLKSLKKTYPDDEPISLVQLVKISGLEFALGCCQLIPELDKHWRLYAVWCARQVEAWIGKYKEGTFAIGVAEKFANEQATLEEFENIQKLMAPHFKLENMAPGKIAAATTLKVAGLAAQATALSALAGAAHYAGLKAKYELPAMGDELEDYCNMNEAYDSARFKAYTSTRKAQEIEFIRLVNALK